MTTFGPRWTADRKRAVLDAIRSRQITRAEALFDNGLTDEELTSWETRYARHGLPGLKARQLQAVR